MPRAWLDFFGGRDTFLPVRSTATKEIDMPLLFDMPLDKLKTYEGCNPRPDDVDEFWDKGLAEMRAIDPQVELVPAEFKVPYAECFDMYFTGTHGARIHAKLLRPKDAPGPHPAVLMFHGYSGNAGDWSGKLGYVAMGFTVAALDCRGQGGRSQDAGGVVGNTLRGHIIRGLDGPPENMLFRQIFLDTAQLAKIVMDMPDVDETRVGATGGSQGGGLTLACASLEPRVARVAPNYPFLTDYKRVWDLDLDQRAYEELRSYFRSFDPLHEREDEVFEKLGYIDTQHLAGRIKGEVIMAVGLMDQVCPPSTQFAAYNKITAPKSLVLYPDFAHENLPGHTDRIVEFMAKL
jgi:cephalosporin-C deacetylase